MTNAFEEQAQRWAKDREVQLSFSRPYQPGPYAPGSFSVGQRDTHHFDVFAQQRPGYVQWYYRKHPDGIAYPMNDDAKERAFAIRGEPGDIHVRDERWDPERPTPREILHFPSVESAMAWVVATLMTQPTAGEG